MVPLKETAVDLYALTLLGGIDLAGYLACLVRTILHEFLYTDHHLCFEGLSWLRLCTYVFLGSGRRYASNIFFLLYAFAISGNLEWMSSKQIMNIIFSNQL